MKPYQTIPIDDCGEPLVPIPSTSFARTDPHPYQRLGAPYGHQSPYWLRLSVLEALAAAQDHLQQRHPQWRIQIFDAYRPVAVQAFMVNHAFEELRQQRYPRQAHLTENEHRAMMAEVIQFWANPSSDPATPPPHSTGAAIDISLVDAQDYPIPMGSPIDEISDRSRPDYFAPNSDPEAQRFHTHRQILHQAMAAAGFCRHPQEWWHFSLGDQLWSWLQQKAHPHQPVIARYGRADILP